MHARHKQIVESFVRVRAFMDANPLPGPLTYAGPREVLAEVVPLLREFAGAQITGRQLSSSELRRQELLSQRILVRHMRPIVAIARTQIEPEAGERLPAALRMPKGAIGVTKLLQACDGMIEAARRYEAAFIENGLPADFLARFTAVRNELEAALNGRATLVGVHVGAATGLQVQLRRGRRAVERLDAIVRASFDGDQVTLARWRVAKRLHQLTGGAASRGPVEEEAPEQQQAA